MSQLIFKFPFKTKYFEQDFYVSNNNFSAYKLIESWPNWPGKWLNVFGSKGCGKTHLSKILEKKIKKVKIVKETNLDNNIIGQYLDVSINRNTLIMSKDVIYKNPKNILTADVVEMNIKTKDTKIYMHDSKKKVKIKSKN